MIGTNGRDDSPPVSQRVVEAVAAETGTPATELEPLYRTIDPDALDELFEDDSLSSHRDAGSVTFCLADCCVHVSHDGTVDTSPIEDERPTTAFNTSEDPSS